MPQPLWLYRDPPLDGPTNMARDEHLLHAPAVMPAALRVYGWSPPTISLGYFQSHHAIADLSPELQQLAVVRRQTGGGAILHDREVTYCIVVDESLPIGRQAPDALYNLAHAAWRTALASTGCAVDVAPESFPMPSPRSGPFFCFEKPGRTDLIVGPDKLVGSAQRRIPATPGGRGGRVLQHGSLLLAKRFADHPGVDLGDPPADTVAKWTEVFIAEVARGLELEVRPCEWEAEQLADVARRRRERYGNDAWTQLR